MKKHTSLPISVPDLQQRAFELNEKQLSQSDLPISVDEYQRLVSELDLNLDIINSQPTGIYRIRVKPQAKWLEDGWNNLVQPPYTFVLANKRFCEILGINKEALHTSPGIIVSLVYQPDKAEFIHKNEEANEQLIPFYWEGRMLVNEKIIWVHFESIPQKTEVGDTLWTGFLYDVSENKLLEANLKQTTERLERAQENARLGSWEFIVENQQSWWSKEIYRLLNLDFSNVLPSFDGYLNAVHPEDRDIAKCHIKKMLLGEESGQTEFRTNPENGPVRYMFQTVSFEYDIENHISRYFGSLQDITEWKMKEENLRQSEERYKSFFENSLDGKSLTSLDGKVNVNKAFAQMLGYSKDELSTQRWSDITHKDDVEKSEKIISSIIDGESSSARWEKRFIHKSGKILWVDMNTSLQSDSNGKPLYFLTTAIDITERKRTADELQKSERKYRSIFENIQDVYFETSLDGIILEISPSIEIITKGQYHRSELIGKAMFDAYIDPSARETILSLIQENGRIKDFETQFIISDNTLINCSLSAGFIFNSDGKVEKIVGSLRDVSERKRWEDAIKLSEEKFAKAFRSSPDLIILTSMVDGKIVEVNERVFEHTGYTYGEFVGRTTGELMFWADLKDREIFFDNLTRNGSVHNIELKHRMKSGEIRDHLVSAEIIELQNEKFIIGVNRDITERKKADEALSNSEANLAEAMKIAKLGSWSYDIISDKFTFSDSFYKILHTTAEKEGGYTMSSSEYAQKFVHPDDISVVGNEIQKAFQSTDIFYYSSLDHRIVCADGETKYISLNIKVLKDVINKFSRTTGVIQDITERKLAELRLKYSEEKFKKAFITSPDAINITKLEDGEYVSINEGFTKMAGYTENDILGKTAIEKGIWVNNADRIRLVKGLKKDGIVQNLIAQFRKKNGDIFIGMMSAIILELEETPHLLSITRDITEIRMAEDALRESEELYRTLVTKIPDGVYKSTPEGKFIDVNPAIVKILGYDSKEELMKIDIKSDLYFDLSDRENSHLNDNNEEISIFKLRKKDGTPIWVEDHGWYGMNSEGKITSHEGVIRDVTERVKVQEALFESQKLLQEITDNSTSLIYALDKNGKFILMNRRFSSLFGLEGEEMIGKSWAEFMPEKIASSHYANDLKVIESMQPITIEEHNIESDGYHTYLSVKFPLLDLQGKLVGVAGISTDITEREKVQKELRESERLLSESQEVAGLGSYVWDLSTGFWSSSIILNRIFGIDDSYIRSLAGWLNIIHPDWRSKMQNYIANHVLGKLKKFDMEYQIINQVDRCIKWVHGLGQLEFDGNNRPLRLIGTITDITERKNADKALRESEEKFKVLFGAMTEMVIMYELVLNELGEPINYRIFDCNDQFSKIIGLKKEDVLGKMADEVFHTKTAPYLDKYVHVAITGESFEHTVYYEPLDKYLLISAVSTGKNLFSTIITDITAIEQVKTVILIKNKELENYIYVTSHDLRSPLVNIQGFSQRLKSQTVELNKLLEDVAVLSDVKLEIDKITKEAVPKSLNFILTNVAKMDTLIKGLLQISRTGRVILTVSKVDINKLFNTIITNHSFQLTEINAKIIIHDIADCYGDENQLNQLFSNIINNAIKYRDMNRELEIEITSQVHLNKVTYKIQDNGIGINSNQVEKIWDVFYRVDSSSPDSGEGLGLSLAKKIAEKNHGKIWAESELGVGTVFFVELQKREFSED